MRAATSTVASETPAPLRAQDVFREHAAFVLRVVRRLGIHPADVEDVAQEVFVVVHRKIATYDGTSTVRTWLFGIASRVASDYRRRARHRREELVETPDAGSVEAAQLADASHRELRRLLDDALDQLDETKRAVFVLYEMEGLPMDEIASGLGCPVNTAYSRLREARSRLRTYFEARRVEGAIR